MSTPRTYLGDGAYAEFDGFGVWVTTSNGVETTNQIYLEPDVLAALVRFDLECRKAPSAVCATCGGDGGGVPAKEAGNG